MMNRSTWPKISIVMVNYNGLTYLKRTIPPLQNLDYPNKELIIVDNGSQDESIDFISTYSNITLLQSPRIREKNYACNMGVDHASGEFILLIDNDALFLDMMVLKTLVHEYTAHEYNGAVCLSLYDENIDISKAYGNYLGYYFTREVKRIDYRLLPELDGILIGHPTGQAIFMKKDLFVKMGGYDEHLTFGGDDCDLGIKLWLMGYKNYLYSKTLQMHIGMPERNDKRKYALKFKEMFYAHLFTITKNYRLRNLGITLFIYIWFTFIKAIKQSVFRLTPGPFIAFFTGLHLYGKNFNVALTKRAMMQKKRIIKKDIFLEIKPPNIKKLINKAKS